MTTSNTESTNKDEELRRAIHMKMLSKSENAKEVGDATVVKLGFAVSIAFELVKQYGLEQRYKSEVWLPYTIFPFQGEYEISSAGRVRRNGKILSLSNVSSKPNSYKALTLSKDNIRKSYLVHRLVAQTFLVNDEGKRTVNHKNGDKSDNSVNNLEWATYSENERHAYDVLGKVGSNTGLAKYKTVTCPACGKEFTGRTWRINKYCSVACANKIISKTRVRSGRQAKETK